MYNKRCDPTISVAAPTLIAEICISMAIERGAKPVEPLLGGLSPKPMQFADQRPGGIDFRGGREWCEEAAAADPMHEKAHSAATPITRRMLSNSTTCESGTRVSAK
jgi:hypothetical protein